MDLTVDALHKTPPGYGPDSFNSTKWQLRARTSRSTLALVALPGFGGWGATISIKPNELSRKSFSGGKEPIANEETPHQP